ncbi:MAG: gamma carbonic anhydrase family protein [Deltaproteobacteria bacterium]|nr:gamma carbonic anhydrase family protein [Deltaproteobacteria bacterium]
MAEHTQRMRITTIPMIYEYRGIRPRIGQDVFLAPGVIILGDVEIGDYSNLWFYTVVRGDVNSITIGRHTNIQDHCMLHVTGDRFPLNIGNGVIVGHRAVLHGCTVHDNALVGIGALVLDGAVVEHDAIVAAGAVVTPGTIIRAETVAVGIPARAVRTPTDEEKAFHRLNCQRYQQYGKHFDQLARPMPTSDLPPTHKDSQ